MSSQDEETSPVQSLSRAEATQMLGYYLSLAPPRWQNFQSFVSVFITVDLALLGATLGVLDKFKSWPQNVVLTLGPFAAFVIAGIAKTALRKQEKHIRELIVVIARFEEHLGLTTENFQRNAASYWPSDRTFIPRKWTEARRAHSSSNEFIDDAKSGGTAGASLRMFTFVQVLSILVFAAILLLPLAPP